MIHEIAQLIWLETPKGQGVAKFLIDYGPEASLQWVVFITATSECWTFSNEEIRVSENVTLGRKRKSIQDFMEEHLTLRHGDSGCE